MKGHLLILSIACFSCLVPPATSHLLAAKVAAAVAAKGLAVLAAKGAAVKGAAVLGAKVALVGGAALLAKKAAAKGAALVAAKAAAVHGVVAKGAAALAAKAAAVKGAALLAKGAALKGASSLLAAKGAHAVGTGLAVKGALEKHLHAPYFYKPHLVAVESYAALQPIPPVPSQFPTVLAQRLSGLYDIAADSVTKQAAAVNELGVVLQNKYAAPYPYQQ